MRALVDSDVLSGIAFPNKSLFLSLRERHQVSCTFSNEVILNMKVFFRDFHITFFRHVTSLQATN